MTQQEIAQKIEQPGKRITYWTYKDYTDDRSVVIVQTGADGSFMRYRDGKKSRRTIVDGIADLLRSNNYVPYIPIPLPSPVRGKVTRGHAFCGCTRRVERMGADYVHHWIEGMPAAFHAPITLYSTPLDAWIAHRIDKGVVNYNTSIDDAIAKLHSVHSAPVAAEKPVSPSASPLDLLGKEMMYSRNFESCIVHVEAIYAAAADGAHRYGVICGDSKYLTVKAEDLSPIPEIGLFNKYTVTRNDGTDAPGGKHHNCRLFVLDLTHDPFAKPAIEAYAEACKGEYPTLAKDLLSI